MSNTSVKTFLIISETVVYNACITGVFLSYINIRQEIDVLHSKSMYILNQY